MRQKKIKKSQGYSIFCILETKLSAVPLKLTLRSSFSYTNIYAALVTDAEAVDPYCHKK